MITFSLLFLGYKSELKLNDMDNIEIRPSVTTDLRNPRSIGVERHEQTQLRRVWNPRKLTKKLT